MKPTPDSTRAARLAGPGARRLVTVSALTAAVLLAACGTRVPLDQPVKVAAVTPAAPAAASPLGAGPTAGATAGGVPQSRVATVDLAANPAAGTTAASGDPTAMAARSAAASGAALMSAATPGERNVYFDFDSFAIRADFNPLVESHARFLSANRAQRLVVEGHADERGSREYNLALGQKRAESVVRALSLLGVEESRVEAVSFGEERPMAQGSGEEAWAKNRRAELKDR